jgi:DNA-binding MarR family transcriptional regulator
LRRQLRLIDRSLLGFYSRTEIALVLALLVLEARGYRQASQRAIGAFFAHTPAAVKRTIDMAHRNGLVDLSFIGRNKLVTLTEKGKEVVYGAIARVTRVKQSAGEIS